MSAIRSKVLLASMAFCWAASAQPQQYDEKAQYGFFIFSKQVDKQVDKKYVIDTRIAACKPSGKKSDEFACVLTQPVKQDFKEFIPKITQPPEYATFFAIGNPCLCRWDMYGNWSCTPPPPYRC